MAIKLDIESGGEYLLPYAKKRLQQLKDQAAQLRIPSLSKKESIGNGIEIFLNTLKVADNVYFDSIRITAGGWFASSLGKYFGTNKTLGFTTTVTPVVFNTFHNSTTAAAPLDRPSTTDGVQSPGHFVVGTSLVPYLLPADRSIVGAVSSCYTAGKFFFAVLATDTSNNGYVIMYDQSGRMLREWQLPADAIIASATPISTAGFVSVSSTEAWIQIDGFSPPDLYSSIYLFSTSLQSKTLTNPRPTSVFDGRPICLGNIDSEPTYAQIVTISTITGVISIFTESTRTDVTVNPTPGVFFQTDGSGGNHLHGATFRRINPDESISEYAEVFYLYKTGAGAWEPGIYSTESGTTSITLSDPPELFQFPFTCGRSSIAAVSKNTQTRGFFAHDGHITIPLWWHFSGVGSLRFYSIASGEQTRHTWTATQLNVSTAASSSTVARTNNNIGVAVNKSLTGSTDGIYVFTPSSVNDISVPGLSSAAPLITAPEKNDSIVFFGDTQVGNNRVLAAKLFSSQTVTIDTTTPRAILPKNILGAVFVGGKAYGYYTPDDDSGYVLASVNSSGARTPLQRTGSVSLLTARPTFPAIENQFTLWNN